MTFQAVRGTADLLPDEMTRWSAVEHTARRLSRLYGYQELRTPVIEEVELFLRSVGETTDIVQKEMFRFADRGGHEIVLRPEGTAAVVRAYLEHSLHKTQGFAKLFYLGPMFRAERPQAGRLRQFHQYGVEAIGSSSPWVDVEVIVLCLHIVRACGLQASRTPLWLSTMGCRDDQTRGRDLLRRQLEGSRHELCQDCQQRFDRNVFRVLDCKNPQCQEIVRTLKLGQPSSRAGFPPTLFPICDACAEHFNAVRRGLKDAQVAYDDTKVFARGLDYYTRTVFEIRAEGLGAKDAIAAGGRYDHLVEELGGPSVGAVGFAAGIERILLALDAQATIPAPAQAPARRSLYLAIAQPALVAEGFRFARQLREQGVAAVMDYDGKSLKAQLREADKLGARLVAILGEDELRQGAITLKDLQQGSQQTVPFDTFVQHVAQTLPSACHA